MKKRIAGGILLGIGIPFSAVSLIVLAFAIPSNFHVEGTGLLWVARMVETYSLTDELLAILLGISLAFSAVPLFLSPRRRTVKLSEAPAEALSVAGNAAPTVENPHPADQGEYVLYTTLLGVERAAAISRDTARALSRLRPGDVLACRSVKEKSTYAKGKQPELLRVSTVDGKALGYMDTAFVRALRSRYPHHRMGLSVSRVSGGDGAPYTCEVRVGVYRN